MTPRVVLGGTAAALLAVMAMRWWAPAGLAVGAGADASAAVSRQGGPGALAAEVVPTPRLDGPAIGWIDKPVRSRSVVCSVAETGDTAGDTGEVCAEHLACRVEMTDPRAGGDLSANLSITYSPPSALAGTWDGSFTMRSTCGTWTGTGQGAAVRAAGAGMPAIYGQVVYQGSGQCASLVYLQQLFGAGTPSVFSGWLNGPLLPDDYERLARLTPDAG